MYSADVGQQAANLAPARTKTPTVVEALDNDLGAIANHLEAVMNRVTSLGDRFFGGEPRDAQHAVPGFPAHEPTCVGFPPAFGWCQKQWQELLSRRLLRIV